MSTYINMKRIKEGKHLMTRNLLRVMTVPTNSILPSYTNMTKNTRKDSVKFQVEDISRFLRTMIQITKIL